MSFVTVSKQVGLDHRDVSWPTRQMVSDARLSNNLYRVIEWQRFLPSPQTPEQVIIMNMVVEAFGDLSARARKSE
jgi:hypothetical protein